MPSDSIHKTIARRNAEQSMSLNRLGAAFASRLSVMRCIIRRMHNENWHVTTPRFCLDNNGYGSAVYTITTQSRNYSLIAFSHYIDPAERTDRVIAQAWDATFSLFDGEPSDEDLDRLAKQTPQQEAGRFNNRELVLSRVNKSVRLFNYVVDQLAGGVQPDPATIGKVGYLMRTTAVYGNGKFGMADRVDYADREELAGPFRAELLAVYLIRQFCFDLIDHLARCRNPDTAVPLSPVIKRFIGIGNATGLGMAPFLISHPELIHNWFNARETALARIRNVSDAGEQSQDSFRRVLTRAQQHVDEWQVEDAEQMQRITQLRHEIKRLQTWTEPNQKLWSQKLPWNNLYIEAERKLSVEAQEMLVSLLMEPYPELVNPLAERLEVNHQAMFDPSMSVARLLELIEKSYHWALDIDFDDLLSHHHFWYASEEKLEPRRGLRYQEAGAGCEMPLAVARDVSALRDRLRQQHSDMSLKNFLVLHPEHRHSVERVQKFARLDYAELRANLLSPDCRPIDILRSKLAFFGAGKFDPKSDLWTRITMYQGAPLATDLNGDPSASPGNTMNDIDDWSWACTPKMSECMSR